MQLNGKQIAECQEALLAAYPSQELLRQMLQIELDQNLEAIAGGSNLRAIVFNLLPVNVVFTANYDDLLERAFRAEGKRVQSVVRDGDIPFMQRMGDSVVNIVKLYGDLTQPDTLVLTSEQYERFFLDRPQLVKLLEVELGRSTLLYLGWSHTDPHFRLLFGETLVQYGKHMRGGYAVMFHVDDAQRRELERRQVRLVELPPGANPTARLAAWLEAARTSSTT